ncbi:MAG: SRPBCC family protein [Acidimicrobiia bacterium]
MTNQDYANMAEVQIGMKSAGFDGLRLNPRQEANLLHMHQVIDGYLAG